MAHYHVSKVDGAWRVSRVDVPCIIGKVATRGEAMAIARMLAGWRGIVTAGRLPPAPAPKAAPAPAPAP